MPDYNHIATNYDRSSLRKKDVDPILSAFISAAGPKKKIRVCDIGCGTGSWLSKNQEANRSNSVEWFGVDASMAMLAHARAKLTSAKWICAKAHNMPFGYGHFDFINSEYAFHQFEDKQKSFEEMYRVLKAGGKMVLRNQDPFESHYDLADYLFPSLKKNNQRRFLKVDELVALLHKVGFSCVNVDKTEVPSSAIQTFEDYLNCLRDRTLSNLWVITDDEYKVGLAKLERMLADGSPDLVLLFERELSVQITVQMTKPGPLVRS